MRKVLTFTVVCAALLGATQAHAQFANKRVGIGFSAYRFTDNDITVGLAPVLEGSYYIENSFEVGIRVPFTIFLTRLSSQQYFSIGGELYVRYLFSEETLRPWLGIEVDAFGILNRADTDLTGNQKVFFGPGASAGLDWFPTDNFSIGPRAFFTLYLALNTLTAVVRPTYGGTVNAHIYF